MTSAIGINFSQRGLLISASAGERFNPKSKTTGLFLARNERFVKLIDDVVREMDVSPDGCKVAFVHGITGVGGWPIPGNSHTIKMIDVCSNTN
ncbi:MAG: hypothetical protein PHY62_04965 [Gallionella sp.]|nr:hypothetical protein [Gallionella sp.]